MSHLSSAHTIKDSRNHNSPPQSLSELEQPTGSEDGLLYPYWQRRNLIGMFLGYMLYAFSRRSLAYAMSMGMSVELGLDKTQIGLPSTLFALTYGISKFFNGVLSDRSSPRYLMGLGLILTGLANILVGTTSNLPMIALFWALNGWFQGFGWPACVKLLTRWYNRQQRASHWSLITAAQKPAGFLLPWMISGAVAYGGWRLGMFLPGTLCVLGGGMLLALLADHPKDVGLSPVRESSAQEQEGPTIQASSTRELLQEVLTSKVLWTLAVAYLLIYFIRTTLLDWILLFMTEVRGYTILESNGHYSVLEISSLIGTLVVGSISERWFGARRGPVNTLFALGMSCTLALLHGLPHLRVSYALFEGVLLFLLGFFTAGLHVLVGIAAAEAVSKKAAATASGLVGWISYLGVALAGMPLGQWLDYSGWEGFFSALLSASLIATLLLSLVSRAEKARR